MNIGDYLQALENIGIKFISASDIAELRKLYFMHVIPKPQRDCFRENVNNKRVALDECSKKIKRIKIVKNDSCVKKVTKSVASISSKDASKKDIVKPSLKRVQFSEDVSVSEYVKPKFQKTAVSWP